MCGKPESYDMRHEQFDVDAGIWSPERMNLNATVQREYCRGSCGGNESQNDVLVDMETMKSYDDMKKSFQRQDP